jgi:hypothetical protein
MKLLFIVFGTFCGLTDTAQIKTLDKVIIKMKTEITFPESMGGNVPGEGDRLMMMGGVKGIESNTTIYCREDFTKVESVSDFGNNIIITDHKSKKTITLIEAMGKKFGFFSTKDDELAIRARNDSIRNARIDSLEKVGIPTPRPSKPEIEYINETKNIAGYNCKKAFIKSKNQSGEANITTIWYCPDFKLANGFSFGGNSGRGILAMAGVNGLDLLAGFPMEYQMERNNGMKMSMTVTNVTLNAVIEDKIFEVPEGYDIKPIKEMQGGEGRNFMRNGGGGNQ